MYQALYRKYRPAVFSDVVGQPQVTRVLSGEVTSGRLSHAYLFTGSRGTGKTSCARIFAKAVNCLHPHDGDPCGVCEICRGIDNGSLLDYTEADAAGNRSIEDIRAIRENAGIAPAAAKYRIFVLDEVHMLTKEAFNALLKILEEPPAHVIFILATTDSQKVPDTIRSRCQRFDFMRIDAELIAERLIWVARQEGRELTPDAASLLAGMADGAMRDALSLLDRCMGETGVIDLEKASSVTGLIGRGALFSLSDAIADGDISRALTLADGFFRASCDAERLCGDLLEHLRCLMIAKSTATPGDILTCTREDLERYQTRARAIPMEKLLYWLDVVGETAEKLRRSVNGRADTEMALVRLCRPSAADGGNALAARIAALESAVAELQRGIPPEKAPIQPEKVAAPPEKISVAQSNAPVTPETVPAQAVDRSDLDGDAPPWDDVPWQPADDTEPEDDEPMSPPPWDDVPWQPADDAEPEDDEPMSPLPWGDVPWQPADDPTPADDATPEDGAPKQTGAVSLNDRFPYWDAICAEAKRLAPLLCGLIDGSNAVENGDTLLLTSINPLFKRIVQQSSAMVRVIETATQTVTGRTYRLKFL